MRFFRVLNARQPVTAGGQVLTPDPLFVQAGSWVGVLTTPVKEVAEDLLSNGLSSEITKAEYEDLKKNGMISGNKLRSAANPVIPTVNANAEAVEEAKPESIDEVLIEGKADPPDALSDDKPKKTRRRKK